MPSTRRQKAKARKSREMDMMSDIDSLDVMLGSGNENPIERELAAAIEQSSVQGDHEANEYQRDNYKIFAQENESLRQNEVRQSFENFTSEFNLRLSHEMDSMLSMVHSQINRAINTAISERVIPEIQNIVSSMSSSGNRDTEASMSPCSQENRESSSGLKSRITNKDSRSVGDLRDTAPSSHYTNLWAKYQDLVKLCEKWTIRLEYCDRNKKLVAIKVGNNHYKMHRLKIAADISD